jgi:ABC-type Zn uptake system ZnuABC Zn-binding protein ZnuA
VKVAEVGRFTQGATTEEGTSIEGLAEASPCVGTGKPHGRLPATKAFIMLMLVGLVVLSTACGEDETLNRPVQAVTSTSVLADIVSAVGGERVGVTSLLPPGADPHTFEPRPSDVRSISEAEVIYLNGLGLEPGALRVVNANLPSSALLVSIGEEVAAGGYPLMGAEAGSSGANPHLWLSAVAGQRYVEVIRDALAAADPEGEAEYRKNADSYLATLAERGAYVTQKVSSIPAENKKLITTHDAFPYLARDIGFEVIAVVATSPGQEPSAADIADLTRFIRSTGVPAVFREPQLGSEAGVLERAAEDAGVEVCILYSGALDDKVTSYLDLLRYNADELSRCLGGG